MMFYGVDEVDVLLYFIVFVVGNFVGLLIIGYLFDIIG